MALSDFNFTLGLKNPPPGTAYWQLQPVGFNSGKSYIQPVLANWTGGGQRTAFMRFNDGIDDQDLLVRSDYPEGAALFSSIKVFFYNSSLNLIGQINIPPITLACYGVYIIDAANNTLQSFVFSTMEPYAKIILESTPPKSPIGANVAFIVRVKNLSPYDTPGQKYVTVGCSYLVYPYTTRQVLSLSPNYLEINRGNWGEFLGFFTMPDRDIFFYFSSYGWRWAGSSGSWIRCEDHYHQTGVYIPTQFRNLQGVFN